MPAPSPSGSLAGWWARLRDAAEPGRPGGCTLVGVLSDAFPAHAVVELPGSRRPEGWQVAVRSDGAGRVRSVEVALPRAPLLWYVELPEPRAPRPATTLVAFSDARCTDGALRTETEARASGVRGDEQVAAVRWYPATGLVHQLYVDERHRRKGIAGKLVQAAFGLQAARGLPGLHGDGRRTDLGEEFRRGVPEYVAWRLAERSERLPAM